MSSNKKNIYIYLGKVILVTLLIVLFVRCFLFESYSVSSSQMETSLQKGDKILINKTAYGIRMPITIFSVPFFFDTYSTALQAPYKRLLSRDISQNDVVLFNNPAEADKPLDKRSLILCRCVALPGDTIQLTDGIFTVNNNTYTASPNTIYKYRITASAGNENIEGIIDKSGIQADGVDRIGDTLFMEMSRYEAYLLSKNLPDSTELQIYSTDTLTGYKFAIPCEGQTIELSENNLIIYRQIILLEQEGNDVFFDKGILIIDGIKQGTYTFRDSYYWMLSDNTENALDSRTLGFIPFKSVIGKAQFVWYSPDEERRLSVVE
ncbi:signal peptidase I [Dysgonomonas sp. PF1-14]|nr:MULTISPECIES: signal peptidase I [unclassified Dysgonomonas]MDH6310736.1 signal peptidase I [Dysgonomonas sp. PF1-14]MDH6340586.1 signal peptidase I [Dysgonomonas sp. PF1-16]MDH6399501.1 signal peptidase I [Dysgonomonas sp. PF1-23]